jgi:glycosyltransferase involved in cell wall biosynthesis
MYRIKNEERWVKRSLESASKICNEIVILDDGSTDNTVKICKSFDRVVNIHEQFNLLTDQTRDKNLLLKMALDRHPDFILTLDGDEIIQPNADKILFEELNILYPEAHIFEFQFLYMWDKPNQYRYDGVYSNLWHKRLIRLSNQPRDLHFNETGFSGNEHVGGIPDNSIGQNKSVRSKIKIFHYGYYDEVLRQKKYKYYTTRDPDSKIFDGYNHIISGKGRFSGPNGIEFRTIPEHLLPDIE